MHFTLEEWKYAVCSTVQALKTDQKLSVKQSLLQDTPRTIGDLAEVV